ncbi:hypothetical protein [Actinocorallia libanotica]|uniref:Uncharacterized protein n=1 Tax=Actinocorallia libanotica TaxID=46162 RepID=A0ABP4CEC9_9ACTN
MCAALERLELARLLVVLPVERAAVVVVLLLVGQVLRIVGIVAVTFATLVGLVMGVSFVQHCALTRTVCGLSSVVVGRTALGVVVLIHAADAAALSAAGPGWGGAVWR